MTVPYGNDTHFLVYEYAPKHVVLGVMYHSTGHKYSMANDRWTVKGWNELDHTIYEVNVYGMQNAAKALEQFCKRPTEEVACACEV